MKKYGILIFTLALLFTLAACADGAADIPTPEAPPSAEAPATEPEPPDDNCVNEAAEPEAPESPADFDPDVPRMGHVVISTAEIPAGFSGFSIDLPEGYFLQPWWGNEGWFRISYGDSGWPLMDIGQILDITAEEFVHQMEISWAEEDIIITYERPTADFPYFVRPRFVASGEGNEMQDFIRDNGQGGIFFVTILLYPEEWETGHGPNLRQTLRMLEVHMD